MLKSKKVIIIALLTVVVLVGTVGGVVLANTGDGTGPANGAAFMERVAAIYEANTGAALDTDALQNAYTQARDEQMTQARQAYEQKLLDEGKITEDQLKAWEDWVQSRPDVGPFGPGMHAFGGHRGFGGFRGGPGMGFRGWSAPDTTQQ
ncbi:MAG: hypothetical protein ABID71_03200 [Chloroflexota bacterium]